MRVLRKQHATDTLPTLHDGDIILIDKPIGITSFDVIRILRRNSTVKKMGHAGTLDPLAEGLLIIAVGSATKELATLIAHRKTYRTTMLIGERTDTGDAEGVIIAERDVGTNVTDDAIYTSAHSFVGCHDLPVPAYSAIKQGGVPLYAKARAGKDLVVPTRTMCIESLEVQGIERWPGRAKVVLEMTVASGVYVRSVVEAIGSALGYPARVDSLRRTVIGDHTVDDAFSLPPHSKPRRA